MTYVGLLVQIHGLARWGDATLTLEEVRARVEGAVRATFPQHEYDGDIVVELDESA